MSKIAILTDSSCDIPQEMAEKYGIDIMSFHILLDDVDYVERESCTNTEFYDKMRAAKGVPSTAAITPHPVLRKILPVRGRGLYGCHSCTHQQIRLFHLQ